MKIEVGDDLPPPRLAARRRGANVRPRRRARARRGRPRGVRRGLEPSGALVRRVVVEVRRGREVRPGPDLPRLGRRRARGLLDVRPRLRRRAREPARRAARVAPSRPRARAAPALVPRAACARSRRGRASASTPPTRPARRGCTSAPACRSSSESTSTRRSWSREPTAREVPRLRRVHRGRDRARLRVPQLRPRPSPRG